MKTITFLIYLLVQNCTYQASFTKVHGFLMENCVSIHADQETVLKKFIDDSISHNKVLGKGSFGIVYGFGDVAMKILNFDTVYPQQFSDSDFLQLENEITTMETMKRYPNMSHLEYKCGFEMLNYGSSNEKFKIYLIMPRYAGSLYEFFSKNRYKKMTADDIIPVFDMIFKIVAGVTQMHQKDIGHFDLKLENVFMADSYTPIIGDFGFSEHFREALGNYKGTPIMLPVYAKQISSVPVIKEMDYWSLAVMIIELLTNKTRSSQLTLAGLEGVKKDFEITTNFEAGYKQFADEILKIVQDLSVSKGQYLFHEFTFNEDADIRIRVPNRKNLDFFLKDLLYIGRKFILQQKEKYLKFIEQERQSILNRPHNHTELDLLEQRKFLFTEYFSDYNEKLAKYLDTVSEDSDAKKQQEHLAAQALKYQKANDDFSNQYQPTPLGEKFQNVFGNAYQYLEEQKKQDAPVQNNGIQQVVSRYIGQQEEQTIAQPFQQQTKQPLVINMKDYRIEQPKILKTPQILMSPTDLSTDTSDKKTPTKEDIPKPKYRFVKLPTYTPVYQPTNLNQTNTPVYHPTVQKQTNSPVYQNTVQNNQVQTNQVTTNPIHHPNTQTNNNYNQQYQYQYQAPKQEHQTPKTIVTYTYRPIQVEQKQYDPKKIFI